MDDIARRKSSVGSGNMSTPSTTSSNASSSGYGYAPLFEALGIGLPDHMVDAVAASASANSGQVGPNNYTDPYSDESLSRLSRDELTALSSSLNSPATVAGIDVERTLLGTGVSTIANMAAPMGLGIPGLIASYVARQALDESRRNNAARVDAYLRGNTPTAGEDLDNLGTPAESVEPTVKVVQEAYSGPKVAEEQDATDKWINGNITTPSRIVATPTSINSGQYYTPGDAGDYTGQDSSEASDSYSGYA